MGGALGAGLGAAAIGAVIASFGASEMISVANETLPWFVATVLLIVTQFAVLGAVYTCAIRHFTTPSLRPALRTASRAR